ncbi:DUF1187 family protein [Enterobacter sp. CP102]|uniref:DUF1187 family protein n=1 Tax=Enterobacter sp. CP102 TaxID=2976431 RepID=UPI0038FCA52B
MYKITAIIEKDGGLPVKWTRYSNKKISMKDCIKSFRKVNVVGRMYDVRVSITDFKCEKVTNQNARMS